MLGGDLLVEGDAEAWARGEVGVARFDGGAQAVEKVKHVDYVERVSASENLRDMLSGGTPAAPEKPLGRTSEATPAPATTAAAAATVAASAQ